MTTTSKYPLALIAGLSLVGSLAGCSTPTADPGTSARGDYADGTYTESGDYQAPSGTESVDVTITLADNVITAVEVVGHATDPEAKLHQGEFIDGIGAIVVGKDIDEISVSKVSGSSLTSGGFNKAIEAIKADAS